MVLLTTTCVWWFVLSLTAVIILLRFGFLLGEKGRPYVADFCMLFTWVSALVMTALITSLNSDFVQLEALNVHSKRAAGPARPSPAELKHIEDTLDYVMKIQYTISLLNVVVLWAAKGTLFAIYIPVQARLRKSLRIFLSVGCIYATITFFITFFMTMFWCGKNISVNWHVDMLHPNSLCAGVAAKTVVIWTSVATLTSDLILLVLGILVVGSLTVSGRREMVALIFVFILGLVSVIAVCVRFAFVIDMARNQAKFSRWMSAETMTALVVCCLPTARTLLRRLPDTLSSSFRSSRSGSSGQIESLNSAERAARADDLEKAHARTVMTERSGTSEENSGAVETQAWRLQG